MSVTPALCEGRFVMMSSESLGWETRFDTRTVSVKRNEGGGRSCVVLVCSQVIALLNLKYRLYVKYLDNIRMDLQEVGCGHVDWIGLAQDRDRWRMLVSAVMNLRVP